MIPSMGIPPILRHTVFVLIIVAGAGIHALIPLEPGWSWLITAASLLSALGAVFTDAPGTAAKMAALKMAARVTGLLALLLFAVRCSWLSSPQGAATVTAGIDLAVCVLNHAQEPIAQIVTDCGAGTAEDVIKILDAHTAAMQRADAGK